MTNYITDIPPFTVQLPRRGGLPDQVHLFESQEVEAINAAIAAGRPLLVRGEPGTGKSQLARAAAENLGWAYVQTVVDSQTESRDLMWHLDSLRRLGEAQLAGAAKEADGDQLRAQLNVENFVQPGPLWWAFNWTHAKKWAEKTHAPIIDAKEDWKRGCVLLIDEIDKAESEVPSGLLEALGDGQFTPPGHAEAVSIEDREPLIIITSNNERVLPDAFMRRCLVLKLELPEDQDKLIANLVARGKVHFFPDMEESVILQAAQMLARDRDIAGKGGHRSKPGLAEFIDLLRAVARRHEGDTTAQLEALDRVRKFTLQKYLHD